MPTGPVDDWTELRSFWEVASTANLTRAAENLGVSQPTLSRRVSRLERRLGTALLVPSTRGCRLTAAGERLRAEIEPMARAAASVTATAAGPAELTGPAVAASFGVHHASFLAHLERRWPGAAWTSLSEGFAGSLRAVTDGRATLFAGIRLPLVTVGDLAGADVALVGRVRMWVTVSASHPLAGRAEVSMAQLAGERWIGPADEPTRQALREVCRIRGFDPVVVHRTVEDGITRGLLADDMGVALASPAATHSGTGDARIVGIPCVDAPLMDILVAVPAGGPGAVPVEVAHSEVRRWYLGRVAAMPRYQAWVDTHPDPFPERPRPVRLDVPADPFRW